MKVERHSTAVGAGFSPRWPTLLPHLSRAKARSYWFPGLGPVVFHIDEAMSWETVRHLERMEPLLVLIRNRAVQGQAPEEIMAALEDIMDIFQEVQQDLKQGKPL